MDERIVVRGARANNLRSVDVEVPKRRLVAFTGVSGSGKSSLAFDTIAAEAQRQLNETFSAFVRQRMPHYGTPDVDFIDGLSTAVIVDQKRLGGGARSTVGTVTDVNPLVRLLFSRVGSPTAYPSNLLSFNDPDGMCARCHGMGVTREPDPDLLVDRDLSLDRGALLHPTMNVGTWPWRMYARAGFDHRRPVSSWSEDDWQLFLYADEPEFEGLITRFERIYLRRDPSEVSESYLRSFDRFVRIATCSDCGGTRLGPVARACRIDGRNIADWCALDIEELRPIIRAVREPEAATMVEELDERLGQMERMGLGYLTLDRPTSSLSGGESQRIKMVRHLASSLVELMYVFDEPTVGLHPADVAQVIELLERLRDRGNTVLVVEHDRDVILAADHIVDVGPAAGSGGGTIVFEGTPRALLRSETATGRCLGRPVRLKDEVRAPGSPLRIRRVRANNLRSVSVHIPTHALVAITGVAGAGKSTLVMHGLVAQHPDTIVVDQSGVGTSVRSCPATYTGMMDHLRRAFAAANGVDASLFSFNSEGACPACDGRGFQSTELSFLDPVVRECPECHGGRFRPDVLEHTLDGMHIGEVLALTAPEATERLTGDPILRRARTLVDVGLGYLTLGQPLSTLSGGECQRIKLATQLGRRGSTYVLDEPTTGLHLSDVTRLMELFDRIVDAGNTVVVVEHSLELIGHADWVIDMGPGGGRRGGTVTFEGTPRELCRTSDSPTGRALGEALGARSRSPRLASAS